jgi:hypothetical protein
VDTLECVRKRVGIAGGASSGEICCETEEEVEEFRACRRGGISVGDGWFIAGEGAVLATCGKLGNKICCECVYSAGSGGLTSSCDDCCGGSLRVGEIIWVNWGIRKCNIIRFEPVCMNNSFLIVMPELNFDISVTF